MENNKSLCKIDKALSIRGYLKCQRKVPIVLGRFNPIGPVLEGIREFCFKTFILQEVSGYRIFEPESLRGEVNDFMSWRN